jgi:hypothetical protein
MTDLSARLSAAATSLEEIEKQMAANPQAMPPRVLSALENLTRWRVDLTLWRDAVATRDGAREFLRGLEDRCDADRRVLVGSSQMSFPAARLFGMQAYVSTQWALSDRITDFTGRVLCLDAVSKDTRQGAQAVAHFVSSPKHTPALLHSQLRDCFGWPVGIAYAVRNHIAHDAGVRSGATFFASSDPAAAPFEISTAGLKYLMDRAAEYQVTPDQTRIAEPWPWSPEDVRLMLARCHDELDEALGLLLLSATRSIEAHVGFLLGAL